MSPLRVAVIGAGFFGSRHVQNYAALEGAELVAVCDADRAMAEAATGRYGGEAITDPETLLGRVDAVSIATPTASHHPLGRMFLDAGIGVLVEKPMTRTLAEADDLTVGIMALVAQAEREAISRRTKEALAVAKARRLKLGNPNGAAALRRAGKGGAPLRETVTRNAEAHARDLAPVLEELRSQGVTSLRGIAAELNERGMLTRRGGR